MSDTTPDEQTVNEQLKPKYFDLIDEHFPKGECKERGAAIVLVAEALLAANPVIAQETAKAVERVLEAIEPIVTIADREERRQAFQKARQEAGGAK